MALPRFKCRELKQEKTKRSINRSFLSFFGAQEPERPYQYGDHTNKIIEVCQEASDSLDRKQCYYAIVNCPPRHGKSDLISRRFPAWEILRHKENEVILASYSAELAVELSIDARRAFTFAADDFGLSPGRMKDNAWGIEGHRGKVNAVGLGGSITGRGAHVLLIDDYIKNRQEAESETHRSHLWESFKSDLWTRRAPVHAVIIVATRWHEDDLVGRILKEHERNTSFPKFQVHRFPAQNPDGSYLFPERFPESYYEGQKALGHYVWQGLYQNDPKPREGNLLRADRVTFIKPSEVPGGLAWRRGWDLASTAKERIKDDPDYTFGTLAAYNAPSAAIYIRDVRGGQIGTLERDDLIRKTAEEDGPKVHVRIEAVGGYVDTYKRIKANLKGRVFVEKVTPQGDKVSRASALEPVFEAGHVYVVSEHGQPHWWDAWYNEVLAFPSGSHDDQVDSLVVALYDDITKANFSFSAL